VGVGLASAAPARAQGSSGRLIVEVKGDRLSVALDQAPLSQTLQAIAARAGFRVVTSWALDERLSLAFAHLPLDAGLKRLLGRHSAVFVYQPTGVLEEIRVYPDVASQFARSEPLDSDPDPVPIASREKILQRPPDLGDPDPSQRLAAAAHVKAGDSRKAIAVLLDLLAPEMEPGIREKALGTLKFFDAVPVDPIAEIAMFDPRRSLSLEALEVLGRQIDNPTAQNALRRVAELAIDAKVREEARALLGSLEGLSQ
jgi:hypothetical protein